ncbi:MAG: hypothetical protein ABIR35_11355 [Polaromonas sp.]
MTSFVNIKYSAQHRGADRVESAAEAAHEVRSNLSSRRGLSTLLLSAMAAAVIVLAYQVMDTEAEGHLLMMWMTMWVVAFTALAFLTGTARELARRLSNGLDAWSANLARRRADQRLWEAAQRDPGLMADLQAAILRAEVESELVPAATIAWGDRVVKASPAVLRDYPRSYI